MSWCNSYSFCLEGWPDDARVNARAAGPADSPTRGPQASWGLHQTSAQDDRDTMYCASVSVADILISAENNRQLAEGRQVARGLPSCCNGVHCSGRSVCAQSAPCHGLSLHGWARWCSWSAICLISKAALTVISRRLRRAWLQYHHQSMPSGSQADSRGHQQRLDEIFPLFPCMHGQAARRTYCHLRQELRGQLHASSQLLPRLTLPRKV